MVVIRDESVDIMHGSKSFHTALPLEPAVGEALANLVEQSIFKVLPHGAHARVVACAPEGFELTEEERAHCSRFAPKRLADFVAGRYCASESLRALGFGRQSIPVDKYRAPIWPRGTAGSIAHTEGLAGAIATAGVGCAALGLDLEQLRDIEDVAAYICTDVELAEWRRSTHFPEYLNVVFSVKEAVYKCIWPSLRRFVSFREIGVSIDCSAGTFRLNSSEGVLSDPGRVRGHWMILSGIVAAVAYSAPGEPAI